MRNLAPERILALRREMKQRGIDLYIVPASDFHGSEYAGDYFKAREYLTGFTGSAGTAVITMDEAGLWTDGRYFIQAERQLLGSGITLYRMGEEGTPSIEDFLKEKLNQGGCIGFDGRAVSAETGQVYRNAAEEKNGSVLTGEDLVGAVWENRPPMSKEPFFLLEDCYSGRTAAEKLADVRKAMRERGADVHILSSLEDIAWLLNIRGNDIAYVPVTLSYLLIDGKSCIWFVQEEILTEEQRAYLKENGIQTRPYDSFYDALEECREKAALYDPAAVNDRTACILGKGAPRIYASNPSTRLKAVKNPVEISNTRKAHVKDGAAFTKFMYWLKTGVGRERMTEISASEYLAEKRREQEHFLEESFETICAYGANAAMMHYAASPESNAVLKPEGFLLVDSGGHYLEGTTDITRTMALGEITAEMRRHFTAVLRGNLNLASAKFLHGCSGRNLDILAREPLWSMGIDYRCGTGHGVGHILSVHEGPNAFRWKQRKAGTGEKSGSGPAEEEAALEAGMITTDEPGVYIEGAYGIRIENELLCRKAEKNAYGQFLCFETITYAPIDLDAVDIDEMTKREIELLNAYHTKVYDILSPYMTEEERDWLKEYTRAV